jgi:hypothetical protein
LYFESRTPYLATLASDGLSESANKKETYRSRRSLDRQRWLLSAGTNHASTQSSSVSGAPSGIRILAGRTSLRVLSFRYAKRRKSSAQAAILLLHATSKERFHASHACTSDLQFRVGGRALRNLRGCRTYILSSPFQDCAAGGRNGKRFGQLW